MWDFCLVIPREYGRIAYIIKDIVKANARQAYVQTIVEEEYTYRYILSMQLSDKSLIYPLIFDCIVSSSVWYYKKSYIINNLKYDFGNGLKEQAFLKALFCFDLHIDVEEVSKKMRGDTLYVDSVYKFGLKNLTRRWKELVSLANDNYFYVKNDDSFLQLLKFLISNIDYRTSIVNVYKTNNRYTFHDNNNKVIDDYLLDFPNDKINFLINSLIILNPQIIVLHFDTDDYEEKTILLDLFEDRIKSNYKCVDNKIN